jgi:hypothetical protein
VLVRAINGRRPVPLTSLFFSFPSLFSLILLISVTLHQHLNYNVGPYRDDPRRDYSLIYTINNSYSYSLSVESISYIK